MASSTAEQEAEALPWRLSDDGNEFDCVRCGLSFKFADGCIALWPDGLERAAQVARMIESGEIPQSEEGRPPQGRPRKEED